MNNDLTVDSSIEFVDLGLRSRKLWAKHNVGATCGSTKESWYGNYYAWGETSVKESYDGNNYTHASYIWDPDKEDWTCQSISKYNTNEAYGEVDDLSTLLTVDDAAYVNTEYRMPTKDEYMELISGTNSSWIENYNGIDGLNGILLTGRFRRNASIFIPAAGYHNGAETYDNDLACYMWSSSLDIDYPYNSYNAFFNSEAANPDNLSNRYRGFNVRCIREFRRSIPDMNTPSE